jgi:hypothetical protein
MPVSTAVFLQHLRNFVQTEADTQRQELMRQWVSPSKA